MPISDLLAQITGEPSPTLPTTQMSLPPKRRLEEQVRKLGLVDKTKSTSALLGKASPSAKSCSISEGTKKPKLDIASRPGSSSSTAARISNGQPTPPPSDTATKAPAKPPKKGSFAEIMARGKAAQSTLGQIGKIQHKKIEKQPSRREREERKALKGKNLEKNLVPGGKFSKDGHLLATNGKNGGRTNGKPLEPVPEKKIKKAALATTGYAGTARPKPGGPSKSSSSVNRSDRGPDRYRDGRAPPRGPRYAYVSEQEEDEEDEEEEDGYGSDMSSDMEAAAFEVDEEEETAEKIARREDAEALKEENRLKREKEEKRRRLAAMAKSRR